MAKSYAKPDEAIRDSEPPSILVWQWGFHGAGPRFAAEIAAAIQGKGADVTLSLSRHAQCYDTLSMLCDRLLPFEGRNRRRSGVRVALGLPVQLLRIHRRLRRNRPDLAICAMMGYWDLPFALMLRLMGIRVAAIVHEVEGHSGDIHGSLYVLQRLFVPLCSIVVVLSRHIADRVGAAWPTKPLITLFHPPFAFADLDLPPARTGDTPSVPLRLLVAGRMWKYKGIELARETAHRLGPDRVRLRIVGKGAASLAADPAPVGNVTIDNRWLSEAELVAEIDAADLVLFPYLEASQSGLVPIALSRGRPVVVTRVGGLAEQVRHGENGLVAEAATVEALVGSIASVLASAEAYAEMSQQALATGNAERLWHDFAARLLAGVQA